MKAERVLVIEDELLVGLDVVFALEKAGFEGVEHAATEAEALQLLETKTWSVAIADANLNGRSIERVARILLEKAVPFVVVSGYDRDSLPGVVRDAPVLAKPVSHARLLETVRLLCSRSF